MRPVPATGAELTIDLGALVSNYRFLCDQAVGSVCAAAVKANAYGLGIGQVAPALAAAGCDVFFVATVDEGIELRQLLPAAVIYVLNGLRPGSERDFATRSLRPVLNDPGQIDAWSFFCRSRPDDHLPAAIHFDTGMNRLGLTPREATRLATDPSPIAFTVPLIISHLACADLPDSTENEAQRKLFAGLTGSFIQSRKGLPAPALSLANSAGILMGRAYHFNLVRPGIGLYGGNPFSDRSNPMIPVIRLTARILQLRDIGPGDCVGYGGTFRAESPRRIATLDVGYADGYLRAFGGRGFARLGSHRLPVVGRVSMDMLAVDVTDIPEAMLADDPAIDLLGGGISLDEASAVSGLSAYELLTLTGDRYKRRYIAPRIVAQQETGNP